MALVLSIQIEPLYVATSLCMYGETKRSPTMGCIRRRLCASVSRAERRCPRVYSLLDRRYADHPETVNLQVCLAFFASPTSNYVLLKLDIVSHLTHNLGHLGDLRDPLGNRHGISNSHFITHISLSFLVWSSKTVDVQPFGRLSLLSANESSKRDLQLTDLVCNKLGQWPRSQVHGTER
jgi:hypothetical protein